MKWTRSSWSERLRPSADVRWLGQADLPDGPRNEGTSRAELIELFSEGSRTSSGARVSPTTAINLASLWQGVTRISGDISTLPCFVLERLAEGGKERAYKHSAFKLLRRQPNPLMTASVFKRLALHHGLLFGNFYAYIYRDVRMRPTEIVPLDPRQTWPVIDADGRLWYVTTLKTGEQRKLDAANVFHLKGLSSDGLAGYPFWKVARKSIGLTLAADEFGATFFGSGSVPSGMLKVAGGADEKVQANVRRSWNKMHQGLGRHHRIAIMDMQTEFVKFTVDPELAQFLGTREFQVREIARWLNIPAYILNDTARKGYASLEQEYRNYHESTLLPWLVAFEEEAFAKLLSEREKRTESHLVEFLNIAILRADANARAAIYHNAILDGWLSRDEVRQLENMNPIPDGEGKRFLVPKNMDLTGNGSADGRGNQPGDEDEQAAAPAEQNRLLTAHYRLLTDTIARMTRMEVDGVRRCLSRGNFVAAVDEFLDKHRDRMTEALGPVVDCIAAAADSSISDPADVARRLASDHTNATRERLLALAEQATDVAGLTDLVEQDTETWNATRVPELASQLIQPQTTFHVRTPTLAG